MDPCVNVEGVDGVGVFDWFCDWPHANTEELSTTGTWPRKPCPETQGIITYY